MRAAAAIFFSLLATAFANEPTTYTTPEGITIMKKFEIPEKDCPRKTMDGDDISVHYTVTNKETQETFDDTRSRRRTFDFPLGAGKIIKGFELGCFDMCVGEIREVTVPPELAYGDKGYGPRVPPGSTLIFEIELKRIKKGDHGRSTKKPTESRAKKVKAEEKEEIKTGEKAEDKKEEINLNVEAQDEQAAKVEPRDEL